MKLFLDTASIDEIRTANAWGVLGGVTTNPSLLAREKLDPKHIAPIVCWLASPLSAGVTGRVFDVSGRMLSVAEGWHRGPTIEDPDDDPEVLGQAVLDLVKQARPNANKFGYDES